MSRREEFIEEEDLRDNDYGKYIMQAYDRGHADGLSEKGESEANVKKRIFIKGSVASLSYNQGHKDGLSEGEELRTELVEALKNEAFNPHQHEDGCPYGDMGAQGPVDYTDCACGYKEIIALIARAEGGEL